MQHTSPNKQTPTEPATIEHCLQQIEDFSTGMETLNISSDSMERLEHKADVDCFLSHDLSPMIEKQQYAQVSTFLQKLKKKLEQHQQVSLFSRRIFKPPSREKRIWMCNHLKAMR